MITVARDSTTLYVRVNVCVLPAWSVAVTSYVFSPSVAVSIDAPSAVVPSQVATPAPTSVHS